MSISIYRTALLCLVIISVGRRKIRIQIIFQNEDDVVRNIHILNSLKEEINEGLHGIEFIVATKGSLVLIVDIMPEMLVTDEKFHMTLDFLLEKILENITTCTTETIDMVLLPEEGLSLIFLKYLIHDL